MAVRSWDDFVKIAIDVANETGYPLAVLLGQAAIETGRNVGNAFGNNFFGIKGMGNAGSQMLSTWESVGGKPVNTRDNFAVFKTPEDAIRAYINLIREKYPEAWRLRNSPSEMIAAIKRGGYATDPKYVDKVMGTPEFQTYQGAFSKIKTVPTKSIPTPTTAQNYERIPGEQRYKDKRTGQVVEFMGENGQLYDINGKPFPTPEPLWQKFLNVVAPKTEAQEETAYNPYLPPKPMATPYTVVAGDTLWDIAQRTLGSGARWKEIQGYTGQPTQMPIGTKLNIPYQPKISEMRPAQPYQPQVAQPQVSRAQTNWVTQQSSAPYSGGGQPVQQVAKPAAKPMAQPVSRPATTNWATQQSSAPYSGGGQAIKSAVSAPAKKNNVVNIIQNALNTVRSWFS